jgi:hypothetical protein
VLTLLGTLLMLFMRGLDLFLIALKGRTLPAALIEVFRLHSWLEVSWFLLVPMVLNAFILCPIVIKRVFRYRNHNGGTLSRALQGSLATGVLLPLASVAYFILVFLHRT